MVCQGYPQAYPFADSAVFSVVLLCDVPEYRRVAAEQMSAAERGCVFAGAAFPIFRKLQFKKCIFCDKSKISFANNSQFAMRNSQLRYRFAMDSEWG